VAPAPHAGWLIRGAQQGGAFRCALLPWGTDPTACDGTTGAAIQEQKPYLSPTNWHSWLAREPESSDPKLQLRAQRRQFAVACK